MSVMGATLHRRLGAPSLLAYVGGRALPLLAGSGAGGALAGALRPHRPGSEGHAAAAQCGPSPGHRQFRPRHPLADHLGHPARSPDGRLRRLLSLRHRHHHRRRLGLSRRHRRCAADAPSRRHHLLSLLRAHHRHRRRARPRADELLYRAGPGGLGLLCPARALAGHRAEACGFRHGGARASASAGRASPSAISCPMRSCRLSSSRCRMR